MKYMSSAGDYTVDRPGSLIRRAARIAPDLKWPFVGTIGIAILATLVRLLGPLIVRGGIDNGINKGDKGAIYVASGLFIAALVVQYVTNGDVSMVCRAGR